MGYSKILKKRFAGITLNVEDLLLLETYQIKYLPDRVPGKEFAALLRVNPVVHRYLISKYPPIGNFIDSILKENKPINNRSTIEKYCQELLWEIADFIIYNKYPDVFDARIEFAWDLNEIIPPKSLEGKVVIDAGAGTGKLTFMVAKYARIIYAVEPASSFRNFIREKVKQEKVKNLFTIDGFLDAIPLPDNSADVLLTSNAIGWNLEDELKEIERVLKPGAIAIHLLGNPNPKTENPFHDRLISTDWKYKCYQYQVTNGIKIKYIKTILLASDVTI